jgi:hypothetical protein
VKIKLSCVQGIPGIDRQPRLVVITLTFADCPFALFPACYRAATAERGIFSPVYEARMIVPKLTDCVPNSSACNPTNMIR